jgi:chromosome segregation ATPase
MSKCWHCGTEYVGLSDKPQLYETEHEPWLCRNALKASLDAAQAQIAELERELERIRNAAADHAMVCSKARAEHAEKALADLRDSFSQANAALRIADEALVKISEHVEESHPVIAGVALVKIRNALAASRAENK